MVGGILVPFFYYPFNPYYFWVQAFPWLHFVTVTVM